MQKYSVYAIIGIFVVLLSTSAYGDPSPKKQLMMGKLPHDIKCKVGFSLVLKFSDKSPACVKPSSVDKLVSRGWAVKEVMKIVNQNVTGTSMMMENDTNEKKEIVVSMENKSKAEMVPGIAMNMSNDSSQMSKSNVDEKQYPDAPKLVGISNYINTAPAKLAQQIQGRVVVYDFWTFNCINCIHTLPHVVDLYNKYLDKGVLVIGIHSPETIFEKDPTNVKDAVQKYNIQYPVVIDNEFQTWNAFGNHYWPHIYISDSHGKIRYDHIGEGNYDEIDKTVGALVLEQEAQKPKELAMS